MSQQRDPATAIKPVGLLVGNKRCMFPGGA
jgi:hypothetical protein